LAICDTGHALCNQHAFGAWAWCARGHEPAATAAKAMARTAVELLENQALLARVRAEFAA
jgi:hypothetical protein